MTIDEDEKGGCCTPGKAIDNTCGFLGYPESVTAVAIGGGSCILIILSLVVWLPLGIANVVVQSRFDPAADFELLPRACRIVNHTHATTERETGGNNRFICMDSYRYTFSYEGVAYASELDEHKRSEGRCPDVTVAPISPPSLAHGAEVPCWRAVDASQLPTGSTPSMSAGYTCPNTACVKLDDPASEAPRAETSSVMIILAAAGAGGGLVVFGLFQRFVGAPGRRRVREKRADSDKV